MIFDSINNIKQIWDDFYVILLPLCSIAILFFIKVLFIKTKGSWSSFYSYLPDSLPILRRKSIPRESKGEAECRMVLQQLFNKPFSKSRPSFLNNPVTGGMYNLELDCYDEELGLAVEYNGVQHYEYSPYFHKNKEAFYNQKYRDDMKRRLCKDNNITLIEVPYNIKTENIRQYIINEIRKKGYRI
jgi:hypothetical protein